MITFFGRDEKRGMESSEPLLGATSDSDTSPEHPIVPPRNPLRLLGGSADGHGGYEDDDFEYEAHRNRLLKVRLGVAHLTYSSDCSLSTLGPKPPELVSARLDGMIRTMLDLLVDYMLNRSL
jgi:hypothetical protein